MMIKPDNAEESFKCAKCGYSFSRGTQRQKKCPSCGFVCTVETCPSIGASNEGY